MGIRYGTTLAVALLTGSLATLSAQSQTTPRPETTTPRTDQTTPRTDQTTPRTDQTTPRTDQATPRTDAKIAAADEQFVKETAMGGMTEVAIAKLATEKASSARVKDLAGKLVADHSKVNDELKSLAAEKKITLPSSIDTMHQARIDKLSKMTGAGFDQAFLADMLASHQSGVAKFRKQSQSGADADIKSWAAKTLPALEAHLKTVQDLSKQPTH